MELPWPLGTQPGKGPKGGPRAIATTVMAKRQSKCERAGLWSGPDGTLDILREAGQRALAHRHEKWGAHGLAHWVGAGIIH